MESAGAPGMQDHDHDRSSPLYDHEDPLDTTNVPDGPSRPPRLETGGLYDDGMIGVSMSRVQTQMRSPDTPASEKARALNLPLDSFHRILTLEEIADDNNDQQILNPESEALIGILPASADPLGTDIPRQDNGDETSRGSHPHRLPFTKNLLHNMGNEMRRRASTGPTSLMSNLKKYLPDLPSPSFNMSSVSLLPPSIRHAGHETSVSSRSTPPETPSTFQCSVREPQEQRAGVDNQIPGSQLDRPKLEVESVSRPTHGLDGNVESFLSPVSPASTRSRPRSNSESSLYIRRKVSGVSAFDDLSAFEDVTGMVNSRFKAVTDSFQNSSLRLPKLPTIRPSPKRRISPQNNSEAARGLDMVTAMGNNTKAQDHHYTSLKGFQNARNAVEIETPQQRAHPILAHALSKTTGDLVVLGGYRGSILRSAQPPHRQVWVPVKVGLNLRKVDLEVGLTPEDEEKMGETIIPSGVLSHIGPIDICRRLLKHMNKCPNAREGKLRVHDWGYDWRLSPHLSSARLIKFLASLPCNQPDTPPETRGATVVAHSLGGLITRHAVNQRPDLFAGVIYAGVPQHCVNILGPMRNGDDVLLSSRVLTAQVNFTLRTSYTLLPESGRCFIQKHTNKRYDLDFFDAETWDEFRLSPIINPPLHPTQKEGDRRKSIFTTLSNSIAANKPNSWFGGQSSQPAESTQTISAATQQVANKAAEAERLVEGDGTDEVVGPTMKQSQHRPSIATASTIPKDRAREYLRRTLAENLEFKRQLVFNPTHQEINAYPPLGYMFGKTVPTVYGARVLNEEAIKYTDAFDDLAFAAGDGVVLASAAQLPEGYRCVRGGRVESDRGHVGLLGDLEGVGRCLEAVIDARSKGVGLGKMAGRNKSSIDS
ncbi:hypothetical protein PV11_04859 [Exophiala sideris]|uniref:Uncharacterized protein n=1 Tax=Exophiala sideris TaxID=1016849 RepID=A0A0D1W1Z6_9EURO|nr:hypothetical protein PV11_04859 [Exophiala sideris]